MQFSGINQNRLKDSSTQFSYCFKWNLILSKLYQWSEMKYEMFSSNVFGVGANNGSEMKSFQTFDKFFLSFSFLLTSTEVKDFKSRLQLQFPTLSTQWVFILLHYDMLSWVVSLECLLRWWPNIYWWKKFNQKLFVVQHSIPRSTRSGNRLNRL